jgi:serine/threonine protein phosphatase PrpC
MLPTKQTKVNQDSYIILPNLNGYQECWMLGVFDGHGINGHLVSDYVKNALTSNIESCDRYYRNSNTTGYNESPSTSKIVRKGSLMTGQGSTVIETDQSKKSLSSNQGMLSLNKKELFDLFSDSFKKTNLSLIKQHIDVNFSGTTAVTVFLMGNDLYCANLGDSRAVLASMKVSPTLKGVIIIRL